MRFLGIEQLVFWKCDVVLLLDRHHQVDQLIFVQRRIQFVQSDIVFELFLGDVELLGQGRPNEREFFPAGGYRGRTDLCFLITSAEKQ